MISCTVLSEDEVQSPASFVGWRTANQAEVRRSDIHRRTPKSQPSWNRQGEYSVRGGRQPKVLMSPDEGLENLRQYTCEKGGSDKVGRGRCRLLTLCSVYLPVIAVLLVFLSWSG